MPNSQDILCFPFSLQMCLVKFILDNYSKVFGEDNDSVGQESAMICNSTEAPPDTQSDFTDFEAAHAALDFENRSPVFGEDNDSVGQESAMICNSTEAPPDTQSDFTDSEAAHAALDLENRSPSERTCPKTTDTAPGTPSSPEEGGLVVNMQHSYEVTLLGNDTFRMMTSSGSDHPACCLQFGSELWRDKSSEQYLSFIFCSLLYYCIENFSQMVAQIERI
ncbi:uncharacterized protein LOC103731462 [Nannospalax galili]|uniref:uncharacterized protein LOC103731462 n=1 Tax=Nannospalax galili TaxID=1026970 RepID=UPI0004ED6FCE|nr:uncharacterized protein LOC103731462 [Nannospalax galili]